MKRLRDVAVRMRPRQSRDGGGDGPRDLPPGAGPETAARPLPPGAPPTASAGLPPAHRPDAAGPGAPVGFDATETAGAMAGRGFSDRNQEAPIPVRTPFMPSSRDLAGRSAGDDGAPPPPSRRPSVPRRQIWDLDGAEPETDPAASSRPLTPSRPQSHPQSHPQSYAPGHPEDHAASRPVSRPAGHAASHPVSRPAGHAPSHPVSRRVDPTPSHPVSRPGHAPDPYAAPHLHPDPQADLPPRSLSQPRFEPPPEAPPPAADPRDLPDARAADDMASRARRALAAVEEQMGGRDPGLPAAGGAKTRVLGFHAPDLATDPISAVAEKSQADVLFPAGWLVVVDGPGRGAYFAVSDSVSSIGRGEDQAISLNFGDATVSRQNHAAIAYDAEQNRFFLGHGNKSNIVRRNGMPVLSTEEILHGDTIRVGKTSLRFVALCGPDFRWGEDDATQGRADD